MSREVETGNLHLRFVHDADLIVRGRIITMDPDRPVGRAMAVSGDRILAVGTEAQAERWRGRGTKTWAVPPGHIVVPGFIDAHAHVALDAWRRTWVPLGECKSHEEVVERLRARAIKTPVERWIVGRGWDESTWPERRYLTRNDLDRASTRHPVLANRVDGHMCSVNSVVLRRLRFRAGDVGVETRSGRPTGVLKEDAASRARQAIPHPSDEQRAELLAGMIAYLHSLGITSVHDMASDAHIRAYQLLRRQGRLTARAYLMPYADRLDALVASGLRTGFGDAWLRLGAIKVFADGSFGARTAALHKPYADDPHRRGQLIRPPRELAALLARVHEAGFRLAVHAIGDRAVDVVLDAYERILDEDPREDHRHRMEHLELTSEDALDRVADLGVLPSMQPNFVARWSHPGGMYEARLGPSRLRQNNLYRQLVRRGARVAFGSDGMPYGPLYGMRGAIEAPFPAQRLRFQEALRCYTINGAFAAFEEDDKGSLAQGKLADFVVVSGTPGPRRGSRVRVVATVVGGRLVYGRAPEGPKPS